MENKNRAGGTSDATSSSSLIISLIVMSFDDFYPQKRPFSLFEDVTEQTDGPTDRHNLSQRCVVAAKKL